MCLPVKPFKIEREWTHAGLMCAVTLPREARSRCGYVRVPLGHPLHGADMSTPDLDVHGGLTFAEIEPCKEHEDGQGWWFGFDCAHAFDAAEDPDVDLDSVSAETRQYLLVIRDIHRQIPMPVSYAEHYWTHEEVVAETERLAEQLAALG